jgi:Reverse transcriptase (RNA-dependent DNA polymerase)
LVLGPLLFIIFVNSIFKLKLRGKLQLFADDAVLLYDANNYEELKNNMEHDLKLLNDWLTKYRLTMNVDKTKFLIFQTKNSNTHGIFDEINFQDKKILKVSNYKYLGLWLDDRLDFSVHISKIKSKLAPMVGVFRRINKFITTDTLKTLYFSYVHSHIAYLISIWGAATANRLHALEVLQNKALKNLRRLLRLFPSHKLSSKDILPIKSLRTYDMILMVHKITKGLIKYNNNVIFASQIHHHNTRNAASSIYFQTSRTNVAQKSFSRQGFEEYNRIVRLHPYLLEVENIVIYKTKLKEIIFGEYIARFPQEQSI